MDDKLLTITLLGSPIIEYNQKRIEIKRRLVRYLLLYLATQPTQVGRGTLCDLFWPDKNETIARKNLREALSNLRRELPDETLLVVHGEFVSLDPEKVKVDIRTFDEIVAKVRANLEVAQGKNFSSELYVNIREALTLVGDGSFFSGSPLNTPITFQQWVSEKGQNIEYWRQMMIEWMADYSIASGNLNEALNWLSKALLNDRHNTEMNLLTAKCLIDLGAWSELLHFCDMLESIYPSPLPKELQDLIERGRALARNPIKKTPIIWNEENENRIHYFNDQGLIEKLNNRVYNGGITVILGEAGSGKSRLLREFYNDLEVIPRLMYYSCALGEEKNPFRALVETFKPVVSDHEWTQLDSIYAKALFPLFPFIKNIRQDIRDEDIPFAVGLSRLLPDAFIELFRLVTHQRRCLLILDNAQWCDEESLQILEYIHNHRGPEDIGSVFLAACPEVENQKLIELCAHYGNSTSFEVISIEPFTQDQVASLCFLLTGKRLPVEDSQYLWKMCGGNPALLMELIDLCKPAIFTGKSCKEIQIFSFPGVLQKKLISIMGDLTQPEKAILNIASLLGETFQIGTLAQIYDGDVSEFLNSIESLRRKYIFIVTEKEGLDVPDRLGFRHGLLQKYFRESMAPEVRWRLIQKCIKVLQESGTDTFSLAVTLASLYVDDGRLENGMETWIRAGEIAIRESREEQVNQAFQNAMKVFELIKEHCPVDVFYKLARQWSYFAIVHDDVDTCRFLFHRTMEYGSQVQDQRVLALTEMGFGWLESIQKNQALADEFIQKAQSRIDAINDTELWATLFTLKIIILVRRGEYYQAITLSENQKDSIDWKQKEQLQQSFFQVIPYLVLAYCESGFVDRAKSLANVSIQMIDKDLQPSVYLEMRCAQFIIGLSSQDFHSARLIAEEINTNFNRIGIRWWSQNFRLSEARLSLETGNIGKFWAQIDLLMGQYQTDPRYHSGLGYGYFLIGELHRHLRDVETGSNYFIKGIEATKNEFVRLRNRISLSVSEYLLGKEEDSHLVLNEVIEEAKNENYHLLNLAARWFYLVLLGERLPGNELMEQAARLRQEALDLGQNLNLAQSDFLDSLILIRQGRIEEGLERAKLAGSRARTEESFWLEQNCLGLIIRNCPDSTAYKNERKRYHTLLIQMKLSAQGSPVEKIVRKGATRISLEK